MATVPAQALSAEAYQEYGAVIAVRPGLASIEANLGTARRFNHLASLENLRPQTGKLNLSIYRCQPSTKFPFEVHLLERHPLSTQIFIPMVGAKRYLLIVCLGGDRPDFKTLRAFVAPGSQGISYRPGVWHHPMIALDQPTDFVSLIWEDGGGKDCLVHECKPEFPRVSLEVSTLGSASD